MKHLKKILAVALIAVSLFAVALPAMAGSASRNGASLSGGSTDMGRCNNVGPFTTVSAGIRMYNCPTKTYGVLLRYNTKNSGSTYYDMVGGTRNIYSGSWAYFTDYVQSQHYSSTNPAKDLWFRMSPGGQSMSVDWTLNWS